MSAEIFTRPLLIESGDIDELGHVNNIVYLRWAQEMATAHWLARAPQQMIADYVWVVRRHEAEYRDALAPGDQIEARTWVSEAPHGAVWPRFVQISKLSTPKPAAEIRTDWCLLDRATRRVKRVPPELARLFIV